MKPKITVDRTCDAAYLAVSKKKSDLSKALKNGLVIDYDADGWLVGIEFLDISVLKKMIASMEEKVD